MSTTAVPTVIDYLVTTFSNDPTVGKANPPVPIYDGPVPNEASDLSALWIGVENVDNTLANTASSSQDWVGPGNRWRNEQLTIFCTAQAANGIDARSARVAVYSIISAVENILRTNANLGGNVLFLKPGSNQHRLTQWAAGDAFIARVAFRIDAFARIGSAN